jgi:hypothetical protein
MFELYCYYNILKLNYTFIQYPLINSTITYLITLTLIQLTLTLLYYLPLNPYLL